MNWKKRTHAGWIAELEQPHYKIVGVLKFDNGRFVSASQALPLLQTFWHRVDRMLFGRAASKGLGVQRWCFTEFGACGDNLHQHFMCTAPIPTKPLCVILNAVWSNLHVRTAPYKQNWITPVNSSYKAAAYTSKGTKLGETDIISEQTSFQPVIADVQVNIEGTQVLTRVANKITGKQLSIATKALDWQIEQLAQRARTRQQR